MLKGITHSTKENRIYDNIKKIIIKIEKEGGDDERKKLFITKIGQHQKLDRKIWFFLEKRCDKQQKDITHFRKIWP